MVDRPVCLISSKSLRFSELPFFSNKMEVLVPTAATES